MDCPRCSAHLPEVAHFCHRCGQDLVHPEEAKRKAFAAQPDEPVASFALVSSIMPRGVGQKPQTYRLALVIALTAALLAAIFGALPIAVLIAAFAVPVVYIVYVYDVNLWDDQPIPVTVLAFILTGALAAGFLSILKFTGLLAAPMPVTQVGDGVSFGGTTLGGILTAVILVPIVGEIIRNIGPVVLASRPKFDDLMDGVSFGIIAGVAYSAADTLVRHWPSLTGGFIEVSDPGTWASLIFLEGFVKPLIIGTATGIACGEFAGLGEGYDGFTTRYLRGFFEAVLANVLYSGGIYFLGLVDNPTLRVMLQVIWGLIILGILIIRIRNVLHHALMEEALEAAAREGFGEHDGVGEDGALHFCHRCEMPLVPHAAFCTACGVSARTGGKPHKKAVRPDDAAAQEVQA